MDKNLLEVSMMLGDAIKKLDNLSAYKPDPYAHLKEAQERGETIQEYFKMDDEWCDMPSFPAIKVTPEKYRIKPKEKKKLYKWAFRNRTEITHTEYWLETECFYETKVDAANNAHGLHGLLDTEIIRIDSSMIEVEA